MAATGALAPRVLLDTFLCWTPLVALQVVLAAVFVWPRRGGLSRADALDRFCLTQSPWGLWLLAVAAWSMAVPPVHRWFAPILWLAVLPLIATSLKVSRFFLGVSGLSRRRALLLTAAHQLASWILILPMVGLGIQVLPRMLGWWTWLAG